MPRGARAAEGYPTRPIRLVVPYAAGGSSDQMARPWIEKAASLLGTAYIENIGGAGGALGSAVVAQSEPNGYSLLLGNVSTQVMIPVASSHPAYDTGDFQAIYRLITSTLTIAVHPLLPVNNLQQLAAYAKENPGKISYGTPGTGTGNHLVGEMFRQQSGGADIVHIPYRGIASAINDLIGGQILVIIAESVKNLNK